MFAIFLTSSLLWIPLDVILLNLISIWCLNTLQRTRNYSVKPISHCAHGISKMAYFPFIKISLNGTIHYRMVNNKGGGGRRAFCHQLSSEHTFFLLFTPFPGFKPDRKTTWALVPVHGRNGLLSMVNNWHFCGTINILTVWKLGCLTLHSNTGAVVFVPIWINTLAII